MSAPENATGDDSRAALRRCLWWCWPALLVGAFLRVSVLLALPEAYYGTDSNSYFEATSRLWNDGTLDVKSKRRWIYPVLLMATPALPGRTLTVIAIVQHGLGLATIFGIGWITLHLTRRPQLWVPLVTTLAAVWPRMLWYEHEVIAESCLLAVVVLSVALALPAGSLRQRQRLFWFLLAATAIVAVKPHGRPLWIGLLGSAALLAGRPWRWDRKSLLAGVASIGVMLSSGKSDQGAWLLLSSALPVVRTDAGPWPEYRAILRPQIEEARADLSQYPWRQGRYKKMLAESKGDRQLGEAWTRLRADRRKFSSVARSLALDGILHSPLTYTRLVLTKMCMVLSDDNAGDRLAPGEFWRQQEANNDDRWQSRPREMRLLYETDHAGYQALVLERRQRRAWYEPYLLPFTKAFAWTRAVGPEGQRSITPTWLSALALLGLASCLRPTRFRATAPLWLSLLLYMGIIFAVGDTVSRYLLPVEWIGMVFLALGLDWMLDVIWRVQPPARAAVTPASDYPIQP